MKIINGVDYYPRESDDKEAFAVRYAGKVGPVLVLVHGIGERSQGTQEDLINVVEGFDYDGPTGPLTRQYAIESTEIEAFAKKYGVTLVTVTYPTEWNPNDFNYVLNTVIANYRVDKDRLYIHGFSLGGGAVLRYVTSSVENASRVAGAGVAAPVNWATNIDNIMGAGLQMVCTTYEKDNTVSPNNVKNFVANLNARGPKLLAYLKIYPGTAHGGFSEILGTESYWQWMVENSRNKRIAYTGETVAPAEPAKPSTLQAVIGYDQSGTQAKLNATGSIGNPVAWKWSIVSVPSGVNRYDPSLFPGGAGYKTSTLNLPKAGSYVIELEVTNSFGEKAATQATVTYPISTEPRKKVVASFDSSSDLVTYEDQTTEKAIAVLTAGKWQIKTAAGLTYDF